MNKTTTKTDFTADYRDVLELAGWLNSHCYFTDTDAVLDYFQRPDRYQREWGLMQLYHEVPESDVSTRSFVEEMLDDERSDADRLMYFCGALKGEITIERKYRGSSQPDTWVWEHEDYDGPPSKLCGCGKTLGDVFSWIHELEVDLG